MSDGIPLLDSWITKATVARDALAKAEERIRELEAELGERSELQAKWMHTAGEMGVSYHEMKARAEKAEARVAELETQLRSTVSCNHHEMPERWYSGQREEPLDVTQERLHAQDEEREAD